MAADMQEAPHLRSAGVITIPSAFDAETPAATTEDGIECESAITTAQGSIRPSFDGSMSKHMSMSMSKNASIARTEEFDTHATGFAAAMEAVRGRIPSPAERRCPAR